MISGALRDGGIEVDHRTTHQPSPVRLQDDGCRRDNAGASRSALARGLKFASRAVLRMRAATRKTRRRVSVASKPDDAAVAADERRVCVSPQEVQILDLVI
jgi:hypothetical protein